MSKIRLKYTEFAGRIEMSIVDRHRDISAGSWDTAEAFCDGQNVVSWVVNKFNALLSKIDSEDLRRIGIMDEHTRYGLFAANEEFPHDIEQLTHWNSLQATRKSKAEWFEQDRNTFILAKVEEK